VLTGAAAAGRQPTREKANVEHQRRFRGAAVTHTHAAVREAPFQGGHTEACHRLHKLSKRHVTSDRNSTHGAGGNAGSHGIHQPPREEPKKAILRGELHFTKSQRLKTA